MYMCVTWFDRRQQSQRSTVRLFCLVIQLQTVERSSNVDVCTDIIWLYAAYRFQTQITFDRTRIWANAQRDGALLNIGGALCSMLQSLADAHY